MDSNIMDIKGVADYLQIKEQTVYKLVQNKKLPAIKIGGSWKVKKDHIDHKIIIVSRTDSLFTTKNEVVKKADSCSTDPR